LNQDSPGILEKSSSHESLVQLAERRKKALGAGQEMAAGASQGDGRPAIGDDATPAIEFLLQEKEIGGDMSFTKTSQGEE